MNKRQSGRQDPADDKSMANEVNPATGDRATGHHSAEDWHRERSYGEAVDRQNARDPVSGEAALPDYPQGPAAGRYGGYGGLREPGREGAAERPPSPPDDGGLDRDYLQWRDEQLRSFDDDYRSWRDQGHGKFNEDFESWRKQRQRGDAESGGDGSVSQQQPEPPASGR